MNTAYMERCKRLAACKTVDEVEVLIVAAQFGGIPAMPCECAIARFIRADNGPRDPSNPDVTIDLSARQLMVRWTEGKMTRTVMIPGPAFEFAVQFDAGQIAPLRRGELTPILE